MENFLINLLLIIWFLITVLFIISWIIGNIINEKFKSLLQLLTELFCKHKFLGFLVKCVLAGIFLQVLIILTVMINNSESYGSIVHDTVIALGGGLFAAILYDDLRNSISECQKK